MSEKCPVCGKEFVVLWPYQWVYKRHGQFICTWKCLRDYDRKEAEHMQDVKRDRTKIVDEILEEIRAGRNPIEYLKHLGYANPSQAYSDIRKMMKKQMPEKFSQLPDDLRAWNKQHSVEIPEGNTGIVIQKHKQQAVKEDDFVEVSIKSKKTGNRYEWSEEYNIFTIRANGDEITFSLEELWMMLDEMPEVTMRLGVKR